jgi:hypothetical protein
MQLDIWIIATSNTENGPYIEINGNIEDDTRPCDGPIITQGTKSNCHYQSLIPTEMFHLDFHQPEHCQSETLKEAKKPVISVNAEASTTRPQTMVHSDQENAGQPLEPTDDCPLMYESSGKILTFLRMSDDYVMKCPLCKTETKYIVRHIGSNTYCKNQISKEEFISQFQLYKKEKANKDHANRQRAWRERQRAQDAEKAKREHAIHQRTRRESGERKMKRRQRGKMPITKEPGGKSEDWKMKKRQKKIMPIIKKPEGKSKEQKMTRKQREIMPMRIGKAEFTLES